MSSSSVGPAHSPTTGEEHKIATVEEALKEKEDLPTGEHVGFLREEEPDMEVTIPVEEFLQTPVG